MSAVGEFVSPVGDENDTWYYTESFVDAVDGTLVSDLVAGQVYVGVDGGEYIILGGTFQSGFEGVTAIPEPSTLVLLGMGAVGLLVYALRRRC